MKDFRMPESHDRKILKALADDSGCTTLTVAARAGITYGRGNGRMMSGAMRSWLTLLERRGLVAKMDDQKPICWIRTAAGTAALQQTPGA